MRVECLPAARLAVCVYIVDDAAPSVHITLVAGHQQPVAKAVVNPVQEKRPVRQLPRLRHRHRKTPSIDAAVPLAVTGAPNGAVQPDVRGGDASIRLCPFAPGICVIDQPVLVLGIPGLHVGVEGQRRRRQIERVIADHVVVVFKMGYHLCVVAFAVTRLEAPLDFKRVARPVEAGRLPHQRAATAVEHAANYFVLMIIVVGLRISTHIETGKSFHTLPRQVVIRVR